MIRAKINDHKGAKSQMITAVLKEMITKVLESNDHRHSIKGYLVGVL